MSPLREANGFLVSEQPFDESVELLTSYHRQSRQAFSRGQHIWAHQVERCTAFLMPSETVPQAHDKRANQFVGGVDRIKLRQLTSP